MRRWAPGVALVGVLGAAALLLWLKLPAQAPGETRGDQARGASERPSAEPASPQAKLLPQEASSAEAGRFLQIAPTPHATEAERRLTDLWPRYQSHLAYLKMAPEEVLNTVVLGQIIAEQSKLTRELEAVAELADPGQTDRAVTQGAELEEAFAGWLQAVAALYEDEALSRQLDSLSELHYASAEKGFSLAEELSKE